MENPHRLTKAEKREVRKQEWEEKLAKEQKAAQYKKFGLWGAVAAVIALGIFGLAMLVNSPSMSGDAESNLTAPAKVKREFTIGNPSAKVKLIEYGDFQCPACAAYHPVVKQLLAEKGDEIHFSYRYFPLTNIHPNARVSGQAGYAANQQGKFWEMFDLLFQNQKSWENSVDPRATFAEYAQVMGLDVNKFKEDMDSSQAIEFVNASEKDATSLGLLSTPSFFVNGKKIKGPANLEEFKKIVDEAAAE